MEVKEVKEKEMEKVKEVKEKEPGSSESALVSRFGVGPGTDLPAYKTRLNQNFKKAVPEN